MKNKNKIKPILFGQNRMVWATADSQQPAANAERIRRKPDVRRPSKPVPIIDISKETRQRVLDAIQTPSDNELYPEIEVSGEISLDVDDLSSLNEALKNEETRPIAEALYKDLLSIIHAPAAERPALLKKIKPSYPEISLVKFVSMVLDFEDSFEKAYERIGREAFQAHTNRAIFRYAEELEGFDREIMKTVLDEVKIISVKLNSLKSDGSKKTPVELEKDYTELKDMLLQSRIGGGMMTVNTLFSSYKGRALMEEIITSRQQAGVELLRKINFLQGPERAIANHKENLTDEQSERITKRTADPEAVNVLANDALKLLSRERVNDLLEGLIDDEKIKILAMNIGHPEFNPVYLERILRGPEEVVINGVRTKYYPGSAALGKGGLGTFYRAAILETPSHRLKFMGVKVANRETGVNNLGSEVEGSKQVMEAISNELMKGNFNGAKFFVQVNAVADDGSAIFYEVVERNGQNITLSKMMKDPEADPVELLRYYLDSLRALALMHRQNIVHGDYNASQVMVNDEGGKLGDFGTVVTNDKYLQDMVGDPSKGMLYQDMGTMVLDTADGPKLIWIGNTPCHSLEIALSPQYYSGEVFDAVAEAGPSATWKIDAYAAGVQLKQLITGKIVMTGAKPAGGGAFEMDPDNKIPLTVGPPHEFANADKNTKLIQIASRLTDPSNMNYKIEDAIAEIEKIIT